MEKHRLKSLSFFVFFFLSQSAADVYAGLRVAMVGGAPVESGAFVVVAQSDSKDAISEISGNFSNGKVEFFSLGDGRYAALVGVGYGAEHKQTDLKISYKLAGQKKEDSFDQYLFPVDVRPTVFPAEKLRVAPRMIAPSPKDRKQIERDNEAIRAAYSTVTLQRFWDDKPVLPVNSQVTSAFGTSRVYNGTKRNAHLGADMRAANGTKIVAPLGGVVVLAQKTFYLGNLVILDHGFGVFTIYGHFSKIRAKAGQVVKKGQVIGLAGATGRVSGPHLHWAAHLNGSKVDPFLLINAMEASGLGATKEKRWVASP